MPFTVLYNAGNRVGEAGLGWSIPFSYVTRSSSLTGRRPTYSIDYEKPSVRDRVVLTLNGGSLVMIRGNDGAYRAMLNAPQLRLHDNGDHWLLEDGSGIRYRFETIDGLGDDEMWLLRQINDGTGGNPVDFEYEVTDVGLTLKELSLAAIRYNEHPRTANCYKHKISLEYRTYGDGGVLSYMIGRGITRVRSHIVEYIDVLARGDGCDAGFQRLSRYALTYTDDADTKQPRLVKVDVSGREGTDAANEWLPVARYGYGAVTRADGSIAYANVGSTAIPTSEAATTDAVSRAYRSTTPTDVTTFLTKQLIHDFTGDGLPDLVSSLNIDSAAAQLMLARGRSQGQTYLPPAFDAAQPLLPTLQHVQLGWQERDPNVGDAFLSASLYNRMGLDRTFSRLIDFNADGRTDILFASHDGNWTLYLNTPDDSGGITWQSVILDMTSVRAQLATSGSFDNHPSQRLPLSQSRTGLHQDLQVCWTSNGQDWEECTYPYGFINGGREWVSRTEWMLTDVNGDGYPDLVANSAPITMRELAKSSDEPYCRGPEMKPEWDAARHTNELLPTRCRIRNDVGFDPDVSNDLVVFYNRAGTKFFGQSSSPFATSITLATGDDKAVVEWFTDVRGDLPHRLLVDPVTGIAVNPEKPKRGSRRSMRYGLMDLNGDGIADRVRNTSVRLGTGIGFSGGISLPLRVGAAAAVIESTFDAHCSEADPHPSLDPVEDGHYYTRRIAAMVDVNGDGLPDYVSEDDSGAPTVHLGTGVGWAPRVDVTTPLPFARSRSDELCDDGASTDGSSSVDSGMFDMDGDGRVDVVSADDGSFSVLRVTSRGGVLGAHDAGRLTRVGNGYGGVAQITYTTAKADTRSSHHVPYSEIVVSEIQQGIDVVGPAPTSLEPTRFAYGDARMRYDASSDRWVFVGYGRRVALRGLPEGGTDGLRLRGVATIQTMIDPGLGDNFAKYTQAGRLGQMYSLDGVFNVDPRELLDLDVSVDSRWHGGAGATYHSVGGAGGNNGVDCTDIYPYSGVGFLVEVGTYEVPCKGYGFAHQNVSVSWRGDAPGSSEPDQNVRTQTNQRVDLYGRPTMIHHFNDLYVDGDDLCEDITYATGASGHMLIAVHTRRFRTCDKSGEGGSVVAGVRFRYDNLPEGQVGLGRPTHRIVERYNVSTGTQFDDYVASVTAYDALGNVTEVTSENRTPSIGGDAISDPVATVEVSQTLGWSNFDAFGLVPKTQTTSGSSADATVSHSDVSTTVDLDPRTLVASSVTDANGVTSLTTRDGFGRPIRTSVRGAGQATEYVLSTTEYVGFEVGATNPMRIRSVSYNADLTTDDYDAGAGTDVTRTESTEYFDELGRLKYRETSLGEDYGGERIISGVVTYDRLGRVAYSADPYLAGATTNEPYGTSPVYRADGSVRCTIRGRGPQTSASSDESSARFASCVERLYRNNGLITRASGANELQVGSEQHGAYSEQVQTAIGWVTESSRWHNGIVELSEHAFDRLGNMTRLIRYEGPADRTGAVVWKSEFDSMGRNLVLMEASALPRTNLYDRWGNVYETRSGAGPTAKRVLSQVDGLGRVVRSIDAIGTVVEPETLTELFYDQSSGDANHVGANSLIGRLSHTRSFGRHTYLGYDEFGRHNTVTWVEGAERYTQQLDYAITGKLRSLSFMLPDNNHQPESVRYSYDTAMRMDGVAHDDGSGAQDMFTAEHIDAFGRYLSVVFGNGVTRELSYAANDRQELLSSVLSGPNGWLMSTNYTRYDPTLRLLQRHDYSNVPGMGIKLATTDYRFDALYRLVDVKKDKLGTNVAHESFVYDGLGNLRQRLDLTAGTTMTITPDTNDRDRICNGTTTGGPRAGFMASSVPEVPFAPTGTITNSRPPACGYAYDGQGNATKTSDGTRVRGMVYDARSRIRGMTSSGITARYRYDALGALAGLDVTGGTVEEDRTDQRFGGLLERRMVVEATGTTYQVRRSIPGPGGVLAMRGPPTAPNVVYLHGDGQANRVFTNETGKVVQTVEYGAFGDVTSDSGIENSASYVNYLWNGGDAMKSFGITQLGARLYDPIVGRFLQRDPLLIARGSSRSHPYAFADSDPINLSDPSGLDPCGATMCIGTGSGGLGEPDGAESVLGSVLAFLADKVLDFVMDRPHAIGPTVIEISEPGPSVAQAWAGYSFDEITYAITVAQGRNYSLDERVFLWQRFPAQARAAWDRQRVATAARDIYRRRLSAARFLQYTNSVVNFTRKVHRATVIAGAGGAVGVVYVWGEAAAGLSGEGLGLSAAESWMGAGSAGRIVPVTVGGVPVLIRTGGGVRIAASSNRGAMLGQAINHVKGLPGTAVQKADLFESLAGQISGHTRGAWGATRVAGADGSHIFFGEYGEALVISPSGQLFRGNVMPLGEQFIPQGGALRPVYDALKRVR